MLLAAPASPSQASDLYRKAQKYEKAGNVIQAYTLYAEAAELEPRNKTYTAKTAALKTKAIQFQQMHPAMPTPAGMAPLPDANAPQDPDPDVDPDPAFVGVTDRDAEKARRALPPPELKLPGGRFDFHINANPTDLFNQVAERCGLQTTFDSDYATLNQKVRFDIADVDCRDALYAAEAATSSFIVPLSSKLIFLSKDTTPKRQANEQTMSVVVPVPTALTVQDLTEIAQAVKQVSGVEKLAWNSSSNEIVIRDRVSRVRIAQAVIDQLTAFRGGVVFDLRFLQLSDSEMLSYGVNLTNSFSLIWSGDQTIATAGATLNTVIRALEHGTQAFGISALQASVVATLTQSNARTILQTQIRSVNGLPATLHVGDKYPILTSGYFGGTASNTPTTSGINGSAGTPYTPPPSFTYQDLGVSLKIMPMIGNNDLITLDVESEYQLLAGQAIDGIPILANRKLATRISIHNDEWAIIGGLMDETDNKSISGVAGLARIPLLGWLFKTQNREKDRDHIVIVMRPHLVGDPPSNRLTAPMRVGTETRALSPL